MKYASPFALVALALLSGCSALTQPQEITISAEPVAAAPEPAPQPAAPAAAAPGGAAAPAQGG